MSEYFVAPRAQADIDAIADRIASDKPLAAKKWVTQLAERIQTLAEWPGMGPARPDLGIGMRTHPFGNYMILYRPTDAGVEIARVVDGHRDMKTVFS